MSSKECTSQQEQTPTSEAVHNFYSDLFKELARKPYFTTDLSGIMLPETADPDCVAGYIANTYKLKRDATILVAVRQNVSPERLTEALKLRRMAAEHLTDPQLQLDIGMKELGYQIPERGEVKPTDKLIEVTMACINVTTPMRLNQFGDFLKNPSALLTPKELRHIELVQVVGEEGVEWTTYGERRTGTKRLAEPVSVAEFYDVKSMLDKASLLPDGITVGTVGEGFHWPTNYAIICNYY